MRLKSRHEGADNAIVDLEAEVLTAGGWAPLDLGLRSPGFLIFVYSAFMCQHMYMRVNAAERALLLDEVKGTFFLEAAGDWHIRDACATFEGTLRSGTPRGEDIDYIRERMRVCPVSRNIDTPIRSDVQLRPR